MPGLAVVLVGEDPASQVYVRNKGTQTLEVGMTSIEHKLPVDTSESVLLDLVARLNADPEIHGILVQLPLPAHLNSELIINAIDPAKDVDGFHISNVGLLGTGQKSMVPCTPLGCLMMLRAHHGRLAGLNAVVVGRSNIVGKPIANLMMQKRAGGNATVTVCHTRTRDMALHTHRADILIVAAGVAKMITADHIKEGVVIIDVGVNRIGQAANGKALLTGDVDFDDVVGKAAAITPVPGGVGPMTITMLMKNTLQAARQAAAIV